MLLKCINIHYRMRCKFLKTNCEGKRGWALEKVNEPLNHGGLNHDGL